MAEALPLYREAVRLKSDYWIGYNNIMYAFARKRHAAGGGKMMKAACGRPGRAPEDDYQDYDQQVWDLQAEEASRARPPDSPLPGECRVSRMR
jgi:hypothetical protein